MSADDVDAIAAFRLFPGQCCHNVDDRRRLWNARTDGGEMFVELDLHAPAISHAAAIHFALDPAPCRADALAITRGLRQRISGFKAHQLADRVFDPLRRNFLNDFLDVGIFFERRRQRRGDETTGQQTSEQHAHGKFLRSENTADDTRHRFARRQQMSMHGVYGCGGFGGGASLVMPRADARSAHGGCIKIQ